MEGSPTLEFAKCVYELHDTEYCYELARTLSSEPEQLKRLEQAYRSQKRCEKECTCDTLSETGPSDGPSEWCRKNCLCET